MTHAPPPVPPPVPPPAPTPDWAALPLPAALFDEAGRFARLNDAAQMWLNLSERSAAGMAPDDPRLAARLRVDPRLMSAIAAATGDASHYPALRWEIGDRTGGFGTRIADAWLIRVEGGVQAVFLPVSAAAVPPRRAARTAIGLADMLAHEIKNPLSGIRGAAQLLSEGLSEDDRPLAELIIDESRRIVALLDQVEQFGDTTAPRRAPVNIHDLLDRARRSVELTGVAARLVADFDPSLPLALVDPDQIVQAARNLIRNAAEALDRQVRAGERVGGDAGTIRIRTSYDGAVRSPEGAALPLQVEIEDDGPGIPESIADQIFEPFISGRENGTGLGLALVSKIAADHGAALRVTSRPGRTVFRLSLPRA